MNVKKAFVSTKNKIVSYAKEHPMEVGYYLGVVVSAVVAYASIEVIDRVTAKQRRELWNQEQELAEDNHGEDAFAVLRRDGVFMHLYPTPAEDA